MAKEIRWGILATGGIAKTFTKDLLIDPTTRGVSDIKHVVVAAASSSSASRAADFLKEVGAPSTAKAYGNYTELARDPNVDIIYIATPHSHHYQNAMLCLEHNKNILCEKAFTVNAAQLRKLVEVAKSKNLFLMEAVWTRYFPVSIYVRDLITSGALGKVTRVSADVSVNADPETTWPDGKSRLVNPDLAGGALLDIGIYSLTWIFQTLYHTQPASTRQDPTVVAAVKKYAPTGVDEMTSMLLTFPRPLADGGDAHGIATTSLRAASAPGGDESGTPAVRIQGDKGELQVFPMLWSPLKTKLVLQDKSKEAVVKYWPQGSGQGEGWKGGTAKEVKAGSKDAGEGDGMFWEADDAARALVEGRKEGKYLGWDESVLIMEVMDEVRRQGGIKYPEKIETLDYPVDL